MSTESIIKRVVAGTKILMLTDLINELEYELYQGIYKDNALNVRLYIDSLKEQVNNLKNQKQ